MLPDNGLRDTMLPDTMLPGTMLRYTARGSVSMLGVLAAALLAGCGGAAESGNTGGQDVIVLGDDAGVGPKAARLVTYVDPSESLAGEPAAVACDFEDAAGKPIAPADLDGSGVDVASVQIAVEPQAEVNGAKVFATVPGEYVVTCKLEGDLELVPATWTVVVGTPAKLSLFLEPDEPAYAALEEVAVQGLLADAYGNLLPDPVALSLGATPAGHLDWHGDSGKYLFSFDAGGTFTLKGTTVAEPVLTADRVVVVDGEAPVITVETPERGTLATGTAEREVKGTVTDDRPPVLWLRLNDEPLDVGPGGAFAVNEALSYGWNLLHLAASDAAGNIAETWRTIGWTSKWYSLAPPDFEDDHVEHGIVVAFGPDAVDDGDHDPQNPDDLATIFEVVVGSLDLKGMVGDPLFEGLACEYHLDELLWSDVDVHLKLLDGALGMEIVFHDFLLQISNDGGNLCGLHDGKEPGDLLPGTGPFKFKAKKIIVQGKLKAEQSDGGPKTKLQIDNIDMEGVVDLPVIGSLLDDVLSWFFDLFKGILSNVMSETLAGIFEAFSFNETFDIPNPGDKQAPPNTIALVTELSALVFTKDAMQMKLHTLVAAQTPLRPHEVPGSLKYEVCGPVGAPPAVPPAPMMLGLHEDFLNQLLFAVWDGGTLSLKLNESALGSFDLSALGITGLVVLVDALLPVIYNSCPGGERVQIGDLWLDASFDFAGTPTHVAFWVQGDVEVELTAVKNEETGGMELGFDLAGLDKVILEVAANEGFFEGDDETLVELVRDGLLPMALDGLAGGLGSIPLPEIDLGKLAEGIPEGTKIALSIQSIGREGAYVLALGSLGK